MSIVKRSNGSISNYNMPSILDDFFNKDVFNWGTNFANTGNSMPAVNIKETPENFLVEMAAPGMEKKDFKIELDGHTLTISSEKQDQHEENEGESYNRKEFSYQSFYRTFHLPKDVVDADKIKAKYENGLLQLEIPKREEAKQKPARLIDIL
ncbi:MAG: heat-shock protein [Chitinophagaceae bacterium]|nr:heat-shock protein [Chitinophagaceae bacterium]MDB5224308.1 heat-shock protein [Chitinophagaceae bacterium]